MSFLLRVVLPDRPGALGAVATALGTVGADILSVDIVERNPGSGCVTDDFVVELPSDRLADSLVTAAATVDGVRVESIRPYAGQIDPHRELELLEALGRQSGSQRPAGSQRQAGSPGQPGSPAEILADGVARVFRAGWSLVIAAPVAGQGEVLARGGAAPEVTSLPTPWWPPRPSRPLDPDDSWSPPDWGRLGTELAVTALGDAALLVGRPALRWAPSELVRLQALAAIAATVAPVE